MVDVDTLNIASPALEAMRAAGIKLAVPLVSQGELLGVLNLGPRLSQQDYSSDDRALLNNLATQAAPALRVAQLVRQQQAEVRARERIEQELQVARLIQRTLLPKTEPVLPGWQISAYYRPARAVGGDFYDFLEMPDGRLAIIVGDVTDKGVPAALGDGDHPQRPARRRQSGWSRRGRCSNASTSCSARDPAEDVCHLPVRAARPGQRAIAVCQRRPRPALLAL